eukprot:2708840-Pyramimonas_sp.AAC.1
MDPVFQANLLPLKMWQQAVKQRWVPEHIMRACAQAYPTVATRTWDKVRGPAGAAWATLDRLGWRFTNWDTWESCRGFLLDLNHFGKRTLTKLIDY